MSAFLRAFAATIGLEGKYSDHPKDRGGPTKYGVTELVARANGYRGNMRDLTLDEAQRIAKSQYWDLLRLDEVAAIDEPLAHEMFDAGFNMGVDVVARFLQRCVNVFNREQTDYPDLKLDGLMGPITVARLRDFVRVRGESGKRVLLRAMNALQGAEYVAIAERRPANEHFVYGWLLQRVTL